MIAGSTALAALALLPGGAAYLLTSRNGTVTTEDPNNAPVPVVPLRLHTQDGLGLGAWYASASSNSTCGVVVVHGNGSRRSHQGPIIRLLVDLDCHVLAVTVRAHGDSEGHLNDFGYSARHDVVAGFEALTERAPRVSRFVLGRSLGAAAALFAAETLGDQVDGYVLESPYANLEMATKNRLDMILPAILVPLAYRALEVWAEHFLSGPINRIAPEQAARRVPASVPVALLVGAADRHATLEEAHRVKSALRGPVDLVVFDHAAHAQLLAQDPTRYRTAVRQLIERPGRIPGPP